MTADGVASLVVSLVALAATLLTAAKLIFRTEVKVEHLEEVRKTASDARTLLDARVDQRITALEIMGSEGKVEHYRLAERVDGIKEALDSVHQDMNKGFERLERKLDRDGK